MSRQLCQDHVKSVSRGCQEVSRPVCQEQVKRVSSECQEGDKTKSKSFQWVTRICLDRDIKSVSRVRVSRGSQIHHNDFKRVSGDYHLIV